MIFFILILNLAAFAIFGYDKFLAGNHQRRIPENTLLLLTCIGGTAGAFFGMLIFRHKTSKKSFLLKFGLIILIQITVIYFFQKV